MSVRTTIASLLKLHFQLTNISQF